MRKIPVLCFLVINLFCFNAFAMPDNPYFAAFEQQRKALAEKMELATVMVFVPGRGGSISTGSGFLVANGYVLTNAHVVESYAPPGKIYILNDKIPLTQATLVSKDYAEKTNVRIASKDLALLKFTPPKGMKLEPLSFNLNFKRFDLVSAWGYPGAVIQHDDRAQQLYRGGGQAPPMVSTEGSINSIVTNKYGTAIVHSAQISGGNSGGPLVNLRGEIVGINTWVSSEGQTYSRSAYAQTSIDLVRYLKSHGITPQMASNQPAPAPLPSSDDDDDDDDDEDYDEDDDRTLSFGDISFEMPEGWSFVEDDDGGFYLVSEEDEDSIIYMLPGEMDDLEIEEIVEIFRTEFEGKKANEINGVWYFLFTVDGSTNMAFIRAVDDEYWILAVAMGADLNQVIKILDSVAPS